MDIKIGQIITDEQKRDAIHVAVAPVKAEVKMYPGQDIGLNENGNACLATDAIGIVDPFLKEAVFPEQWFYMFLYPNTVTEMQHRWQHPSFDVTNDSTKPTKEESQQWIEEFAKDINQTFESLMDAADQFLNTGDWTCDNGESYKDRWSDFPQFWFHYTVLTGREVDDDEEVPFTCSC